VGSLIEKVALGQGFSANSSFSLLSHHSISASFTLTHPSIAGGAVIGKSQKENNKKIQTFRSFRINDGRSIDVLRFSSPFRFLQLHKNVFLGYEWIVRCERLSL
jgi:hypothetical protein